MIIFVWDHLTIVTKLITCAINLLYYYNKSMDLNKADIWRVYLVSLLCYIANEGSYLYINN